MLVVGPSLQLTEICDSAVKALLRHNLSFRIRLEFRRTPLSTLLETMVVGNHVTMPFPAWRIAVGSRCEICPYTASSSFPSCQEHTCFRCRESRNGEEAVLWAFRVSWHFAADVLEPSPM